MSKRTKIVAEEETAIIADSAETVARYRFLQPAIYIIFSLTCLSMALYAALNPIHRTYTPAAARLVVTQNIGVALIPLIPLFSKKVFKLEISFKITACLMVAGFAGSFLGEGLQLYSKLGYWDKILHTISGIWVPLIAICLAKSLLAKKNVSSFAYALVFAVVFSLAIAAFWEIYEFTFDLMLGTNMQKSIPPLFNANDSIHSDLIGDVEEIGEFFTSPEGYRFALMDTMTDMCLCLLGTVIFALSAALVNKFNKTAFDNGFKKVAKKEIALSAEGVPAQAVIETAAVADGNDPFEENDDENIIN